MNNSKKPKQRVAKKDQRTLHVLIMVTAEQKALIESAAEREMSSVSTWGLKQLLPLAEAATKEK